MRALIICLLAIIASISTASSQQTSAKTEPSQEYTVEKQPDGSLKVVPNLSQSSPLLDAINSGNNNTGANAQKITNALSGIDSTQLLKQLQNQEFWITQDPVGTVSSVYVLPKGESPPPSMLNAAVEGSLIAKVSGSSALKGYLPDTESMIEVLNALMTSAKIAACGLPARPKQFGTAVDISAGFGVTGRIEFNAMWETTDLCE